MDDARIWMAFLAGAAMGAGVALLTAPQSGRETREKLAGGVRGGVDRVRALPPAVREAAHEAGEAASKAFRTAYEREMHHDNQG